MNCFCRYTSKIEVPFRENRSDLDIIFKIIAKIEIRRRVISLGHTLLKYDEMRLNSVSTVKARFFCYCCFIFLFLFIFYLFFCFHILSFFHWLFSLSSYFWLLASSQRGSVIHIFLIQYISIIRESCCFSFTLTFIFAFCLLIY